MISFEMNRKGLRAGDRIPEREVRRTLSAVARILRLRTALRVSVAFPGATEMRRLNARYRGRRTPTDVLSFSLSPTEGEILICPSVARRQARDLGHAFQKEVLFLLIHGVLHIVGHDHERSVDARRMFARQNRILKTLGLDQPSLHV